MNTHTKGVAISRFLARDRLVGYSAGVIFLFAVFKETDAKLPARLNGLIEEWARTPFTGTGKPEPLRGALSGWRSRRLTQEDRPVYRLLEGALQIAHRRYPYG